MSYTVPHYTIDVGRLKEQINLLRMLLFCKIISLLTFIQFASFVPHHQESISLPNFDTMSWCCKYHAVEFLSENFFHEVQVNRQRTQISNILQLIVIYGSIYVYLSHSSLKMHLERLQDKRQRKICGIYMKKTQQAAYASANCSKTSKMGKTQLTTAQQLGAQWTCSQ